MLALSPQPPVVLDRSLATFSNRFPQDVRPGNPDRQLWQDWASSIDLYGFRCTSEEYQHDQCWGWTIIRTSYGDDKEFDQAVAAIRRLALVRLEDEYRDSRARGEPDNDTMEAAKKKVSKGRDPLEWVSQAWSAMVGHAQDALPREPLTPDFVITHELVRRYHMTIVQNSQALDEADVSKAWEYAHALDLEEREHGARGVLFIYLDKESIYHLARAPSQEELTSADPGKRSKTAWAYWVKAVGTECEVAEDGNDTDQMMDAPQARRRMRLYDIFDVFIDLCHGSLDKASIERRDRECFDRERLVGPGREWEFCSNEGWAHLRDPWLRELYGKRVRAR